jgi:hypothetical protein
MNELDSLRAKAEEMAVTGLRAKAEETAVTNDLSRRPTWAPRLKVGSEELLETLYELEWLGGDDLAVIRLWARFTTPKRGEVRCKGFELRSGEKHTGKTIWEAQYYDKARVLANIAREIGETTSPEARGRLEDWRRDTEAKTGGWSFGPRWTWARGEGRLEKLKRAVELGQARVMEFAGAADTQMREAGRYFGHCYCCGKALTDPISVELGIGPDCRREFGVTPSGAPGALIIGGSDAPVVITDDDLPF